MKKSERPSDYINNPTFYKCIVEYQARCNAAEAAGEEVPRTTAEIGLAIDQIANRLASKRNFSGYPFVHEMIYDGIENAIGSVRKFNPEKSQNPFAYFTQIIYYAFLRRIKKEKDELYRKKKYYDHMYTNHQMADTSLMYKYGGTAPFQAQYNQTDYMEDLHKSYEDKKNEQQGSTDN